MLRNEAQLGLAASLNRALDEARGRYVARMDADDAAFADWLERSLELLDSRPDLGLVGSGVLDIEEDGEPRDAAPPRRRPRARCAGARSSALRCSTTRWCSSASCSRPMACATTRRSASRRTTSSGPAFSPSPRATAIEAPLVLHRLHRASGLAPTRRPSAHARRGGLAAADRARRARALRAARDGSRAQVWLGAEVAAADVEDAAMAFVELERTLRSRARVPRGRARSRARRGRASARAARVSLRAGRPARSF